MNLLRGIFVPLSDWISNVEGHTTSRLSNVSRVTRWKATLFKASTTCACAQVPHFASLRGKEREIVILRSDNGEKWVEHSLEATEEAVQEVLQESFDGDGKSAQLVSWIQIHIEFKSGSRLFAIYYILNCKKIPWVESMNGEFMCFTFYNLDSDP